MTHTLTIEKGAAVCACGWQAHSACATDQEIEWDLHLVECMEKETPDEVEKRRRHLQTR